MLHALHASAMCVKKCWSCVETPDSPQCRGSGGDGKPTSYAQSSRYTCNRRCASSHWPWRRMAPSRFRLQSYLPTTFPSTKPSAGRSPNPTPTHAAAHICPLGLRLEGCRLQGPGQLLVAEALLARALKPVHKHARPVIRDALGEKALELVVILLSNLRGGSNTRGKGGWRTAAGAWEVARPVAGPCRCMQVGKYLGCTHAECANYHATNVHVFCTDAATAKCRQCNTQTKASPTCVACASSSK